MDSKAEWFRARAADCEKLAARATDAAAKAMLKEMACTWLRLAETQEKKNIVKSDKSN